MPASSLKEWPPGGVNPVKPPQLVREALLRGLNGIGMARIAFTTHLERYVECPITNAYGANVREVLDVVFARNPKLRGYVVDEAGALRRHVSVFVDNQPISDRVGLTDSLGADSEIYILQALSGG